MRHHIIPGILASIIVAAAGAAAADPRAENDGKHDVRAGARSVGGLRHGQAVGVVLDFHLSC